MPIHCPNCEFEMALKGARPGRFHPRCPQCGDKFTLLIPEDPSVMPTVSRESGAADETLAPAAAESLGVGGADAARPARAMETAAPPVAVAEKTPIEHTRRQQPPGSASNMHSDEPSLSGRLGGYEIIQKLGQGGMGAVYLARQLSLDRNVALKILSPNLARDPQFVARFTREAYAAAQLTHHNIVAIHDIGADRDAHYFSMEFVEGDNLAGEVRQHGKLDPEAAAGYVLQAARGLKFAHDHGMVHRDIKPENLLLNGQGIVKVADLGLVKRAGAAETQITGVSHSAAAQDQTQVNMSMGTPAYMPPEQATDAAHVDQRADIYSLGCTLYDLLTGRPPFMGRTAMEVITKHQREQITPPEMIVRNIPRTLSAILLKMVAKRPEDRYQTMSEVIRALEDYLGVSESGPFTPKEEHVKVLEFAVERFNASGFAILRQQLIMAFYGACALGVAALAWTRHPLWAASLVGFAVLATLAYQITVGITQRTTLFTKFRQLVFGAGLIDWISWLAIGALATGLLFVFGWFWPWLAVSVLAVLAALGFHFSIDMMLHRDRNTPLTQVEAMLKQMRLRGLDEMALRQFVCKYAGRDWEAFYEALFGYEAKLQARQLWGKGDRGRDRRRFGAWRDPIIRWIDRKQAARREAREAKLIQKLEAKALAAKGIADAIARKQAKKNAAKVMDRAARLRDTAARRAAETLAPAAAGATKVATAVTSLPPQDADNASPPAPRKHESQDEEVEREHLTWFQRRFGTPVDLILGQQVRFIVGVLILAGFAVWWQQNKGERALEEAAQVVASRREIDVTSKDVRQIAAQVGQKARDVAAGAQMAVEGTLSRQLELPMLPDLIARALSGWNAGLAGAILLISVLLSGRMLGVTMLLAAAVAMIGSWFSLPVIGYPAPWLSALAGAGIAMFGWIFFRVPDGY